MKIYLVGGAVRDQLLGRPIQEKDWVVVGASEKDMRSQGFRQVGKDFPVFLHPETHEEYALARSERKIKPGYTGFEFDTSPTVSLEEDLKRRDITINAMAQTESGEIIDPYQGQADLAAHVLRHVSPAFVEDPVRILRIARFAARFDFTIAPETLTLMRSMVASGEINALVAERVFKELERALLEPYPENFFNVLESCGALAVLFPGLRLSDNIIALKNAAKNNLSARARFAALFYGSPELQIKTFCDRYKAPNPFRDMAILANRFFKDYLGLDNPTLVLDLLEALDAFRRNDRFKEIFAVWCVLSPEAPQQAWLLACHEIAKNASLPQGAFIELTGAAIAEALKKTRLKALEDYFSTNKPSA